jgi:hypothetical protein
MSSFPSILIFTTVSPPELFPPDPDPLPLPPDNALGIFEVTLLVVFVPLIAEPLSDKGVTCTNSGFPPSPTTKVVGSLNTTIDRLELTKTG